MLPAQKSRDRRETTTCSAGQDLLCCVEGVSDGRRLVYRGEALMLVLPRREVDLGWQPRPARKLQHG